MVLVLPSQIRTAQGNPKQSRKAKEQHHLSSPHESYLTTRPGNQGLVPCYIASPLQCRRGPGRSNDRPPRPRSRASSGRKEDLHSTAQGNNHCSLLIAHCSLLIAGKVWLVMDPYDLEHLRHPRLRRQCLGRQTQASPLVAVTSSLRPLLDRREQRRFCR